MDAQSAEEHPDHHASQRPKLIRVIDETRERGAVVLDSHALDDAEGDGRAEQINNPDEFPWLHGQTFFVPEKPEKIPERALMIGLKPPKAPTTVVITGTRVASVPACVGSWPIPSGVPT